VRLSGVEKSILCSVISRVTTDVNIPRFCLVDCRYVKPRQLTVPEFLEEVTTSDGILYLQPGLPKLDIEGFAAEFKKSDHYKDILRVVDSPEIVEEFWVEVRPRAPLRILKA
jgi:hypothetical protein